MSFGFKKRSWFFGGTSVDAEKLGLWTRQLSPAQPGPGQIVSGGVQDSGNEVQKLEVSHLDLEIVNRSGVVDAPGDRLAHDCGDIGSHYSEH